jgi:hypothetical protein
MVGKSKHPAMISLSGKWRLVAEFHQPEKRL